jgi:hypothetical protein
MSVNFSTRGASASESLPVPASGSVSGLIGTQCSVTVTNASGTTRQLATVATARIEIGGESKIPLESKRATSTTVDGSDIFLEGQNVVDDTDIGSGANQSLDYTEA